MNRVFLLFLSCLATCFAFAQGEINQPRRFDLRINAGSTFTLVKDFNNTMIYGKNMMIPGFIDPSNAQSVSISAARSTARSLLGWHVEAELFYRLPQNFSLSVGAGLKKVRFDTNSRFTYFDNGQSKTYNLDAFDRGFGETSLLYLSVTPVNISKGLFENRLLLQAGPTFNFLLSHDVENVLVIYHSADSQANRTPDEAYFDTIGNMRNLIWGCNLSASYKIIAPLSVKVSAQYYVNSMYEDKSGGFDVEKIRALTIQAGVSVAPFAF
ncbi:MAG TPA: hypothetical protein VIU12_21315 [Chryseolinea sp.]